MLQIKHASPEDWLAVLELAHTHVLPGERGFAVAFVAIVGKWSPPSERHLGRARNGALLAVQVCVPLAGAGCLFWMPTTTSDIADALAVAGLEWSRTLGCKIAQALAKPSEHAFTRPLIRAGFHRITRLQEWERDFEGLPALVNRGLRFEPYRESLAADFAATITRTYEGSLDCPELSGTRTIDEILEGHRGQGGFHADCWWLARDGAKPIGVVLLVEMPDGVTWELAYLGLVPEFRGQGLAHALLTYALHSLRDRQVKRVVLAVDERNLPARRLYESLGFVERDWNKVLLHIF